MEMLETPIRDASAWRGEDFQNSDEWIYEFTESDLNEFERALAGVRGRPVESLRREDFPLPTFDARIEEFIREIESGRGFLLLRGMPIDSLGEEESIKLYQALCARLGKRVPTETNSELINSIRDLGPIQDPNARGYAAKTFWEPHTDMPDIVTLFCLAPGRIGGQSRITSANTIYNIVLEEHPEWLPILYKEFAVDWMNQEPEGCQAWFPQSLYCYVAGWLSCSMRTTWIRKAQRLPDVPRLTAEETECFHYLEDMPMRPGLTLSMTMRAGDIQVINNYTTMHDRNLWMDAAEDPSHQRHLLRCWMRRSGIGPRRVSPSYEYVREDYYGFHGLPPAESCREVLNPVDAFEPEVRASVA